MMLCLQADDSKPHSLQLRVPPDPSAKHPGLTDCRFCCLRVLLLCLLLSMLPPAATSVRARDLPEDWMCANDDEVAARTKSLVDSGQVCLLV